MISFIIPAKNEGPFIEQLLKSLKEYRGDYEIVVSDGNSTDNTVAIAQKYTNKVTVYRGTARQTIAAGRNEGARMASGDIYVYFDADVHVPDINSLMNRVLDYFSKDPSLVGISGSVLVLPENETRVDKIVTRSFNFYCYLVNHFFGAPMLYGEFYIVKKEPFWNIGGLNEKIVAAEDYELFRRLKKVGKTLFAKDLVVYHTGRRAHKIGWAKMLSQWFLNWIFVMFFNRAASREWKEIR